MNENIGQKDWEVWQHYKQSYFEYASASRDFLREDIDRVAILKQTLHGPDRFAAIYVLRWLPEVELQHLFNELMTAVTKYNGWEDAAHDAILKIPKEWLLKNIENAAEPYLKNGSDEEYQLLLELYYDIDAGLAKKLALRALEHDNEGIRETGQYFLDTRSWDE